MPPAKDRHSCRVGHPAAGDFIQFAAARMIVFRPAKELKEAVSLSQISTGDETRAGAGSPYLRIM